MDDAARLAAIGKRAANEVSHGMVVGLGSGSTAAAMVVELGKRVADGLSITGVATSTATKQLAESVGIKLVELDDIDQLDLCIDGADEIDPKLNLVKGRGGALLYEKLVAQQAQRLVIIASAEKLVSILGTRLPLPVEVVPFGWKHTAKYLAHDFNFEPSLRSLKGGSPFITDGGHYILDCRSESGIRRPDWTSINLKDVSGVVDHGLFVGMTDLALTIDETGEVTEHRILQR